MTALILELVELPVMLIPPKSPSVEATGQQKHPGEYQGLLVALTIFLFSSKLITRSATSLLSRELLDGEATTLTGPPLQMKSSQK